MNSINDDTYLNPKRYEHLREDDIEFFRSKPSLVFDVAMKRARRMSPSREQLIRESSDAQLLKAILEVFDSDESLLKEFRKLPEFQDEKIKEPA